MINSKEGVKMKVYAYIGIITKESKKNLQQEALKRYAIKNSIKYTTVFEDKLCEKNFERPHYRALQQLMRRGDIIIIKELERLGRNCKEIQQELQIFKTRGVKLLVLDILMIQSIQGEPLNELLQDTIINLLDYVA